MTLKTEEVRSIAHLARLQINDTDVEKYTNELSKILAVFDEMKSYDTTDVLPMAHPMDATQRLRPDVVSETNQRDKFQAIAPDVEQHLYRVPKVIE